MAENIDREAAIRTLRESAVAKYPLSFSSGILAAADELQKMPAADVVPVVNGRWEAMHYEGGIFDGTNFDKCSACGYERIIDDEKLKTAFNYCPNCGARMDENT